MLKTLLMSLVHHPIYLILGAFHTTNPQPKCNQTSVELAVSWLQTAQNENEDGGFSRGFYLNRKRGWDSSYTETTGYIVDTLFDVRNKISGNGVDRTIQAAVEYLVSVQRCDGAFTCIDNFQPQVFDTGQVLYGLLKYKRYSKELDVDSATVNVNQTIIDACNWLCAVQDHQSGTWTQGAYNSIPHVYYTRVAAILYDCGKEFSSERWKSHALRFMSWALDQRNLDGSYKYLAFTESEEGNYLHAMAYLIEGLHYMFELTGDKKYLIHAENYFELIMTNTKNRVIPTSRYDRNTLPICNEYCITGLCQVAAVGLKLYDQSHPYFQKIIAILYFVKAQQINFGFIKGGMWGSIPLWGNYATMRVPNWGVKFLIDALLCYDTYRISCHEEQRTWITESFKCQSHYIRTELSVVGQAYQQFLEENIKKTDAISDYGAGNGSHVSKLRKKGYNVVGWDPIIENPDVKILDLNDISPAVKGKDVVYMFETVQHVADLETQINEIGAHLEIGSIIIIGDRLKTTLSHMYKIYTQITGKSMYSIFSPFKENWYNKRVLSEYLKNTDFEIEKFEKISDLTLRGKYLEPRFAVMLRKIK